MHAALHAGVFSPDADPGDNPFAFGRERVLDGVEAYLAVAPRVDAVAEPADPLERDPKVRDARKARREAEKQLREARKREREVARNARERLARRG